jgi:hypothetical protein
MCFRVFRPSNYVKDFCNAFCWVRSEVDLKSLVAIGVLQTLFCVNIYKIYATRLVLQNLVYTAAYFKGFGHYQAITRI